MSPRSRPRVQPHTPARRVGRRSGGLYIDEPAATPPRAVPAQAPQAQPKLQAPEEDDDPELQAALAASHEVNDLEELAKWLHLAEALCASALEEEARKAKKDADSWAFLAIARRQEEAMRQAVLREEGECLAALQHEAELQATAAEQRQKEAARLAHLRMPVSPPDPHSAWERAQWSPWPESPAPSDVSSCNNVSPTGGHHPHRRRRGGVLLGVG
ncbi:hypothetical protein QYE76_050068 [Lolium multiflorum]|uniref:Uncharacterized protein n=1 Tax=Lolium multiflorum TaxID=4521 RepID=A0AAD8SQ88_LOLMU|nr:hypothetical protein QYE76_050068 [Lolium multiflorum]